MRVLVLGSGVIGTCSAWYLARAGFEVTVVDRQQEPAQETSFANAGQISPGYASPWAAPGVPLKALKWLFSRHAPLAIYPGLDPDQYLWLAQLLRNCTAEPRRRGAKHRAWCQRLMTAVFKVPTSVEEMFQLQRETTHLLREHRIKIALNKLCPRHKSEDAVRTAEKRRELRAKLKTDDELIAAAGSPAPTTAVRYFKRAQAAFSEACKVGVDIWMLVEERSSNADSWYTFKAGVQFYLVKMVEEYKRKLDEWFAARRAQKPQPYSRETFDHVMHMLPLLAKALAATPDGASPEKFEGGGSKRSPNSKSASIRRRPEDWREQVAATMEGDLRLLYLMQCVTGCRPAELRPPVAVCPTYAGDVVVRALARALVSDLRVHVCLHILCP